ncbi:hypothetical protein ACOME3_010087 [Neoechinorhynchus agilis]
MSRLHRREYEQPLNKTLRVNSITNTPAPKQVPSSQLIQGRKAYLENQLARIRADIDQCERELKLIDCAREEENLARVRAEDRHLNILREKFNSDPETGIEMAIRNQIIQRTHKDVARFLYSTSGLSKESIGNYLGNKDDFAIGVLYEFTSLQNFQNIGIVDALRRFLGSFRLPGEGQKIDRIVESFAQHYQSSNPETFANADIVHVLAYAIVLLNTSLHNKNASKKSVGGKMTCQEFCSMVTKGFNGPDFSGQIKIPSQDLIIQIYESVRNEALRFPNDQNTGANPVMLRTVFASPEKSGMLYKQGGNIRTWKRRFFVLQNCCLYYFENETDRQPKGIVPLNGLAVRDVNTYPIGGGTTSTSLGKAYVFEIYPLDTSGKIRACKTGDLGKIQEGNHRVYRLATSTANDKFEWISALKLATSRCNESWQCSSDARADTLSEQGFDVARKLQFRRNGITIADRGNANLEKFMNNFFRGSDIDGEIHSNSSGHFEELRKKSMSLEKLSEIRQLPENHPLVNQYQTEQFRQTHKKRGHTVEPSMRNQMPLPLNQTSNIENESNVANGVSAVFF